MPPSKQPGKYRDESFCYSDATSLMPISALFVLHANDSFKALLQKPKLSSKEAASGSSNVTGDGDAMLPFGPRPVREFVWMRCFNVGVSSTTSELLRRNSLSGFTSPPRPVTVGCWNSQFLTATILVFASHSCPLLRTGHTQIQAKKVTAHAVVSFGAVQDKFPFNFRRYFGGSA